MTTVRRPTRDLSLKRADVERVLVSYEFRSSNAQVLMIERAPSAKLSLCAFIKQCETNEVVLMMGVGMHMDGRTSVFDLFRIGDMLYAVDVKDDSFVASVSFMNATSALIN